MLFMVLLGARLSQIPSYFYDKVLSYFYKGSMKSCGKHVVSIRRMPYRFYV